MRMEYYIEIVKVEKSEKLKRIVYNKFVNKINKISF